MGWVRGRVQGGCDGRGWVPAANGVVVRAGDVTVTRTAGRHAGGMVDQGRGGRPSVAAETADAVAYYSRHGPVGNLADTNVTAVADEDVTQGEDGNAGRNAQAVLQRGPVPIKNALAVLVAHPVAGDRLDRAVGLRDHANPQVLTIRQVDISTGVDCQTPRGTQLVAVGGSIPIQRGAAQTGFIVITSDGNHVAAGSHFAHQVIVGVCGEHISSGVHD